MTRDLVRMIVVLTALGFGAQADGKEPDENPSGGEATPTPRPRPYTPVPVADSAALDAPTTAQETKTDWMNPNERPHTKHVFLGLRYRGTFVPKFLVNLFVDEGANAYTHSVGLELDVRHDGYSVIPNFTYTDYSLNDTLFLQKGEAPVAGNYSFINSNIKGYFLGVDMLWSKHVQANIDLEAGLGLGVGALVGEVVNNWVYPNGSGPFVASTGAHYSACNAVSDGDSCDPFNHSNAKVAKVGRYVEPNWYQGGLVPTVYARVMPTFGIRFKPMRDLEARLQIGISLTEGFFFGFSANYRLWSSSR